MSGAAARRLATVLAAVLAVPLVARADRRDPVPEPLQGVGVVERLNEPLPLDASFVDERGRAVALGDYFQGRRPVLINLVYYRCPHLCGLVLDGTLAALRDLEWTAGEEFEIVTISIDPRDTPARAGMKKQAVIESYERPRAASGWHFLSGGQQQIDRVAEALGFRYRFVESQGEYAHPAALFVATPDGRVARYLHGVRWEPRTLRFALVEAGEGRAGSTVEQFVVNCFRYDPESGSYVPAAFKIMRLGGVITLLVVGLMLAVFWRREALRRRAAHPSETTT